MPETRCSTSAETRAGQGLAEAVLSASRGRHAFEDCVERLATAIRLGVYPYGSMLPPERQLAARMGVSRATLREAIAALRSANLCLLYTSDAADDLLCV